MTNRIRIQIEEAKKKIEDGFSADRQMEAVSYFMVARKILETILDENKDDKNDK